ncbi:hypothetical protein F4809DRAFT_638747 [Biscogniauxia mediterranea]|nr:hypothetical protein F4809DRAFT_638747 [Biscogniauxia mediterranea]
MAAPFDLEAVEENKDIPVSVSEENWEILLQDAGFCGFGLLLKLDDEFCLMVATSLKQEQENDVPPHDVNSENSHCQLILLVDQDQDTQLALASHLHKQWDSVQIVYFDDIYKSTWDKTDIVVSLLEVGPPRLAKLNEHDFQILQALVQRTRNLLWVTAPRIEQNGKTEPFEPQHGVVTGLLRVVYHEPNIEGTAAIYASYVTNVAKACFKDESSSETEFIVRNDHLAIGRLVTVGTLEEDLRARVQERLQNGPWMLGLALAVEVGTPGMTRFGSSRTDNSPSRELILTWDLKT